jgi:pseudouridine synthase
MVKQRLTESRDSPTREGIRIQKLLSMAGVASRRAAEALIAEGRVSVNGETVRTLGTRADPNADDIRVDRRRVPLMRRLRYIVLHKPRGFVTTRKDPQRRRTIMDLLTGVREYVYPVGRLDFDSAGLLIVTSDGDLAARLMHPRHAVERVYEAIVSGEPTDDALETLRRGVFLDGDRTAPARVRRGPTVGRGRQQTTLLTMTLTEGRNRQVRRMCALVGHPVRQLTRVRMGPIRLGDLRPGRWRDLTPAEVRQLDESATNGPQRRRDTEKSLENDPLRL